MPCPRIIFSESATHVFARRIAAFQPLEFTVSSLACPIPNCRRRPLQRSLSHVRVPTQATRSGRAGTCLMEEASRESIVIVQNHRSDAVRLEGFFWRDALCNLSCSYQRSRAGCVILMQHISNAQGGKFNGKAYLPLQFSHAPCKTKECHYPESPRWIECCEKCSEAAVHMLLTGKGPILRK